MNEETRTYGSSSEEEMRERMRAAGYADWEIDDEIEESIAVSKHVRANTEHHREHGTFLPTVPPIERMRQEGAIGSEHASVRRDEMRSSDVIPEEAMMANAVKSGVSNENGPVHALEDDPYLSARIALRASLVEEAAADPERTYQDSIAELEREIEDRRGFLVNETILRECGEQLSGLDIELGASLDAGDMHEVSRIEERMEEMRAIEQVSLANVAELSSRHSEWTELELNRSHLKEAFVAEAVGVDAHFDIIDDRRPEQILAQVYPGEAENTWSAVIIDGAVHFGEQCFNSPEEAFDYAENNVTGITPKQMQMNASRMRHGQTHSVTQAEPDVEQRADLHSVLRQYEQAAPELNAHDEPSRRSTRETALELSR